jgi:transposase InsO family protein
LERWELGGQRRSLPPRGNPTPYNALTPEEQAIVRELVGCESLVALSPRELSFVALEDRGVYVSHVAFWRYMREVGIYDREAGRRSKRRARCTEPPDTSFASGPNQLWSWDISHLLTYTPGEFYYLFTILDWVSRKVVAWHLSQSLASSEVPKVWDKAIAGERLLEVPRCLWPASMSDRGTQMKSRYSRRYFALLDIEQLFGRPGTPNDNARIEALFSNLKTHPFYPGRFKTFEEALAWCRDWFEWYNNEHHHSALGFVTPAQRHSGEHVRILEERRRLREESLARRRQYNVAQTGGRHHVEATATTALGRAAGGGIRA